VAPFALSPLPSPGGSTPNLWRRTAATWGSRFQAMICRRCAAWTRERQRGTSMN